MREIDARFIKLAELLESKLTARELQKAMSLLEAEDTIQVTLGGQRLDVPAEYTWMACSATDEIHFFTGEPKYRRGEWQGPGKIQVADLWTDYETLGAEYSGEEYHEGIQWKHYMKAIFSDIVDYFSDAVVKIRPGINLDDRLPDYTTKVKVENPF